MASRESQGLQVALILFVMVTVVLAVTTYLYFSAAERERQKAEAAEARARQSDDTVNSLEFQNQIFRHVLGYEMRNRDELNSIVQSLQDTSREEMEQALADFQQDMRVYGVGFQDQVLNYRTLPSHLLAVVNDKNSKLAEADRLQAELVAERNRIQETEERRLAKVQAELVSTQQELRAEREKFNRERQRILETSEELAALVPEKEQELNRVRSEAASRIDGLQKETQQNQVMIAALQERLEDRREETFEEADGEVTWVDQNSQMVWINLGSADGLRRQMTFSVYDRRHTGVATAPIKARIEVTRVMEPRLAEARILEDNLSDPIMQGDIVYSPSFRRGQRTHFALVGIMDITGDGRSDLERVKSLITANNGVVDAELQPDGTIVGQMTSTTQFLVRGEAPTDRSNERLMQGYSEMVGEATRQGIQSMTLDNLLDRMGYVRDSRVVPMQRGAGALEEGNGGEFQRRQPRSAY